MNSKLENKLYKKYPKLFRQRKLSMKETALCWGLQCGDGWYWLIDKVCEYVNRYAEHKKIKVEFNTVKEKFGELRIYADGEDQDISRVFWFAGYLSNYICEHCGSIENITQTKGWITTLCKKCLDERKKNKGKSK